MPGLDPLQGNRFLVRKRDGRCEEFNEARIFLAIESAFRATLGIEPNEPLREVLQIEIEKISEPVVQQVLSRAIKGKELEVEGIQDAVEEQLMRAGHLAIARRYILYRDERRRARSARAKVASANEPARPSPEATRPNPPEPQMEGRPPVGQWATLACQGLEQGWSIDRLISECLQQSHQGVGSEECENALGEAAKLQMAREPAYERVAARFLLRKIYRQALPRLGDCEDIAEAQRRQFSCYIARAVESEQLAPELLDFNLELLASGLRLERDELFGYHGLEVLHDEYLLREWGQCVETPQYFWMRLAMGLALGEDKPREVQALEFYDALSTFRFIPSAAILFNAGTRNPHLAACYSASGWSDLEHITARLGGRVADRHRCGLTCSWLEPWHINIGDFLAYPRRGEDQWDQDLSKGVWIPDLFMKRVQENSHWTLFNPEDTPDLHRLYGKAFERRYAEYEEKADRGEFEGFSRLPAQAIWAEILASISETGQPWLGFKDAANVRATQDATGIVQSANLCGDVLLPTGSHRAAACGVGAINLAAHTNEDGLDMERARRTVATAMRMLDNALDVSVYPDGAVKAASVEQRPIALGVAGFQDMLHQLKLSYASPAAVELADRSMESISYYAILASTSLAMERGAYPGFDKSKWNLGVVPLDTLALADHERGGAVEVDRSSRHDWMLVRESIHSNGMRNCATTGITPVNDGAAIMGVTPSIEPSVRLRLGKMAFGQVAQWDRSLVADLKGLSLWSNELINELQDSEGSIQKSGTIPGSLKEVYRTAFEIEPQWLLECAARRQKWLDMSQALTLYIADRDPARISEIYMLAWMKGLKTTRQLPAPAAAVAMSAGASNAGQQSTVPVEAETFSKVENTAAVSAIVP